MAQLVKNLPAIRETQVRSLGWEDALEEGIATHSSILGFPGDSDGEESACNAGDLGEEGLIPGSGRSPGGGDGNPPQYICLGNPMDKGACWTMVHRFTKIRTPLSDLVLSTHINPGPDSPEAAPSRLP